MIEGISGDLKRLRRERKKLQKSFGDKEKGFTFAPALLTSRATKDRSSLKILKLKKVRPSNALEIPSIESTEKMILRIYLQ